VASPRVAAAAFRRRHGFGTGPIRDIAQVIEEFHGAWVMQMKLPTGLEARTLHDPERQHTLVCVATSDNPERQRFTLAHELGHLEAGSLSTEVHNDEQANSRPEERWANTFARDLLVPVDGVRALLSDNDHHDTARMLSEVVRTFAVSPSAALIQLNNADIITRLEQARLTDLWTSKSLAARFGWRSERDPAVRAAMSERRPAALVEATTTGYLTGRRSLEELAHVAGERDLAAFRSELESDGLVPPVVQKEDESNTAAWAPEDFSDLRGPQP
jgi:hypothetical protein